MLYHKPCFLAESNCDLLGLTLVGPARRAGRAFHAPVPPTPSGCLGEAALPSYERTMGSTRAPPGRARSPSEPRRFPLVGPARRAGRTQSPLPHTTKRPILSRVAQSFGDRIVYNIPPLLNTLFLVAQSMVEEPLLPNDTTFPRKKPLPVGKGSIHRGIGGESGDEMDMIGHNECKTRIPFAICSAELNGVKNDRRRGFVGKRTATPCIGWRNAVVCAV